MNPMGWRHVGSTRYGRASKGRGRSGVMSKGPKVPFEICFLVLGLTVTGGAIAIMQASGNGEIRGRDRGYHEGVRDTRETAVFAGVAEWIVTDETGSVEFHWILPSAEESD